ncbi:TonB-dependent receptor plug domain-containing protein [Dyella mobilis]|uniref:TonB-dependent receptor n=1 Tax=Dyella mobilis TaxID=1849582 RepID=A0ABS2KC23_9GAMM|nr:TonB-dependent receptor [Dyella mobilis]MBM7128654.1 TonB-dependent receptor [Dyella mobilis]GLQ99441.1 TonB-dependent receptor [Dyella mobilis]
MNIRQHKIAHAVRVALILGSCGLATAVAAQTAPADQTAPPAPTAQSSAQSQPPQSASPQTGTPAPPNKTVTLQGITVTGSLIRSVDVETAQPVTELSHEALQQQGFVSVGQILQNVPSVGSAGTSNQSALGDIVGQYASLRGLGASRTLILVDGQRYTTDIFGQTDLSTLPSSLIDSVEILQDGASSIYGSDAIAGVINIHTKNVDGLYVDTYNSTYSPGNYGKQAQFSLTGGKKFSRGDITFNVTVQNINQIMSNQVWFSRYGFASPSSVPQYPQSQGPSAYGQILSGVNSATGAPTVIPGQVISPVTGGPLPMIVNMGGNGMNIADYHPDAVGIQFPSPYPGASFANDYGNQAYEETLIPDNRLRSYFLKGDYKITDHVSAVFTGTYNTNNATSYTGGYGLSSSTPANGPNLAAALGLPAGSLGNAWFPTLSGSSYYNPLPGNNLSFFLPLAQPNRVTVNNIKQYGFRAGLQGDFSLGENEFNWDAGYSDYKYIQDMGGGGNLNLVHLYEALGPSFMGPNGQVLCGTPGNVIQGCVPLNPFSGSGGLTPAESNYLNYNFFTHSWSEERQVQANLSGDMFTLPQSLGEGDATFAVGADHRDVSGGVTPDLYTQEGLNTNLQQNPGSGSYGINEAYAEINLPLLKEMTGAQLLDFDVSHRLSHYTNFGTTNNNSYKIAYKPIDDLLIRASYGTGFRAGSISNLYGGTMQSFTDYLDPCDVNFGAAATNAAAEQRCLSGIGNLKGVAPGFTQTTTSGTPITSNGGAQSTTPFLTGANSNLKPESSKSYTFGFVYSPSWFSGFNLNLDYYRIRINNVITLPSANSILDNCYVAGELNECSQFQRNAATGQVVNLLQAVTNEGFIDERGTDLGLSYNFPETPVGKFKIDTTGTYINSLHEEATSGPGAQVVSYDVGTYDQILGPVWRFRDTTNLNWSWRAFSATWTLRYYSSLRESCRTSNVAMQMYFPCPDPTGIVQNNNLGTGLYRQGGLAFNDLQVSWKAPWKGQISLGATDVFNRRAPLTYVGAENVVGPLGPTGTDGYTSYAYNPEYDIGRVIYLKYSQKLF